MGTTHVTVQEAQERLDHLLARVEAGDVVIITRPGHPSIRLSPVEDEEEGASASLPSLRTWRTRVHAEGEDLSEIVRAQRDEERY